MSYSALRKSWIALLFSIPILLSSCAVSVQHHPSRILEGVKAGKPATVLVADVGMQPDRQRNIGCGVSYWLPNWFFLADAQNRPIVISNYVAKGLCEDLDKMGYQAKMSGTCEQTGKAVGPDEALQQAKAAKVDYLVTTKVTDGRTNYWGFLVIPFFQPVWTRIGMDVKVYDLGDNAKVQEFSTYHKSTEWYFGKVMVFDAIFDAALWGRHWQRHAWGQSVVPKGIAISAIKVNDSLNAKPTTLAAAK